jgi:AraC-like DNA-binding protein
MNMDLATRPRMPWIEKLALRAGSVGVPSPSCPKTLDRILRFQRFLGLARQSAEPRLADLAFEAGYSDQAHLTREVRRLSGFSPATVLRQLGA